MWQMVASRFKSESKISDKVSLLLLRRQIGLNIYGYAYFIGRTSGAVLNFLVAKLQ
jgi:hypothetical protein